MAIDYDALSRVVCVANGKGGVNKTSIVAQVGGLAAAGGYRTLLVDLDPQGDLSDDLGYYSDPVTTTVSSSPQPCSPAHP